MPFPFEISDQIIDKLSCWYDKSEYFQMLQLNHWNDQNQIDLFLRFSFQKSNLSREWPKIANHLKWKWSTALN